MINSACPECGAPHALGVEHLGQLLECHACKCLLKPFIVGGETERGVKLLKVVAPKEGSSQGVFEFSKEFLEKYRPFKKLGEGGMGVVHKAVEVHSARRVAVKSLIFEGSKELTQRFINEGQLLAKMNHKHVVKLLDVGHSGAHHYMVFELVDGVSLKEEMERDFAMPVTKSLEVIMQVLKGLEYAHDMSVIHRDIKPENILLTRFGYVKIADFGLAKSYGMGIVEEDASPDGAADTVPEAEGYLGDPLSSSQSTLVVSGIHEAPITGKGNARRTVAGSRTGTGAVVGTPSYMSPEQAQGRRVNHLTDIYSTGIILWELLAGQYLFKGNDILTILEKQIHQNPPPVSKINSKVPPYLDEIVSRAVAKSHLDRYQSAHDFSRALQRTINRLQSGSSSRVVAVARPLPSSSSHRVAAVGAPAQQSWGAVILTAFAVAMLGLCAWIYLRGAP